ncbi:MAG: toll/interleukin-1 receptor domain-containing protein [Egibacteraceae bacterium]
MPEIFINYRTGDEEAFASLVYKGLSERFGSERIFLDKKSIALGEDYTRALPTGVYDSEVLLAVIGPRWLTATNKQGHNVHHEDDWVRREILEAFDYGVRVIPVLIGDTPRIRLWPDLPKALATLANRQDHGLDLESLEADLRALGDKLVQLVPSLAAHDQAKEVPEPGIGDGRGSTMLRAGDHAHQQTGGTSTVVKDPRGPVHTGTGDQFTGDGVNYVTGSNSGGIRQTFGSRRKRPNDER